MPVTKIANKPDTAKTARNFHRLAFGKIIICREAQLALCAVIVVVVACAKRNGSLGFYADVVFEEGVVAEDAFVVDAERAELLGFGVAGGGWGEEEEVGGDY